MVPLAPTLAESSKEFLDYLDDWMAALPVMSLQDAIEDPAKTAILAVDVINGFCSEGALASPRVGQIVEPIARLLQQAEARGVRHFILPQDTHEPDAVEFAQWPVHCVRGTAEAQTVAGLRDLPFSKDFLVMEKNSIDSGAATGLDAWVKSHPEVTSYIVTGDCTDLCTYQLAMRLRLDANARQIERRVILPANCVQTYDRPVSVAREQGGLPHPGDLIHVLFLYHMLLNGVEVCAEIV